MSSLNILGHSFTQNIFYRFENVDGKIVLLQKLSENFSHCSESQTKNSETFSVFCRNFGHWRAQIFCGHMNEDWKKHNEVLQSWFSIDMQCVCLRKTSSFCGWLFYKFLFVLVQTSYCHCTYVNNLMQTAAQF